MLSKVLLIIVLAIVMAIFSYLFVNSFKDYKQFCLRYIDQIHAYKAKNGVYPSNLDTLKKPTYSLFYDSAKCGYTSDENGFGFITQSGLIGVSIYSTKWGYWVDD